MKAPGVMISRMGTVSSPGRTALPMRECFAEDGSGDPENSRMIAQNVSQEDSERVLFVDAAG